MSTLSISLTLGKVSTGGANLEHNNREIIASNVDVNRICNNIVFENQDVRDVYNELFCESLEAYNAKQKQPCRRIHDYYEHIFEGNREEAYYEIVVQFGDSKVAPVGSKNGEIAKNMLIEYARNFQERNPNLKVFCSNLHMDEASPHCHINFIPFYTEGRQKGLSKGVSMKSALIEQGFSSKSKNINHLVLWENEERKIMEQILKKHGIGRDIKNDNSVHKSVDEYKESQDTKRLQQFYKRGVSVNEISAENVERLKRENSLLEIEKSKLEEQRHSPYKSFYYSVPDKQDFVQSRLPEMSMITVEHLTKDYGQGRGVFDVSFAVNKGEVFGFLGPNGSGKTTTIRHLMGFSNPEKGLTSINGKDCFKYRHEIMRNVGFLPGEVPLPEGITGWEFIRLQQEMKGVCDDIQVKRLLEIFELDPKGSTKRMSLGMRRKLAIVAAFMHDPDILILDEPSNGLDPVMQDRFITYLYVPPGQGRATP
jgi:ABC-type Na+ transport system ATPase subunit NatA